MRIRQARAAEGAVIGGFAGGGVHHAGAAVIIGMLPGVENLDLRLLHPLTSGSPFCCPSWVWSNS